MTFKQCLTRSLIGAKSLIAVALMGMIVFNGALNETDGLRGGAVGSFNNGERVAAVGSPEQLIEANQCWGAEDKPLSDTPRHAVVRDSQWSDARLVGPAQTATVLAQAFDGEPAKDGDLLVVAFCV